MWKMHNADILTEGNIPFLCHLFASDPMDACNTCMDHESYSEIINCTWKIKC